MITDLVSEEINMDLVYRQVEDAMRNVPIKEEFIKEETSVLNSDDIDMTSELTFKQIKLFLLSTKVFSRVDQSLFLNQQNAGYKTYSLVKVK